MFQLFQNQDAGAFSDDKSIALLVPGTRGFGRLIIPGRKGSHGRKSTDAQWRDRSLASTADHHVRIAILNQTIGVPDGMGTGGASRCRRRVRPFGTIFDGYISAGQINDTGWDKERRNAARSFFQKVAVLALN